MVSSASNSMMEPDIRLDVNRVVLFERDMDRTERTRHDHLAAAVEGEPGPSPPFGERAGNGHAARRDPDDFRAGADMGAQPGIIRQPIRSPAGNIVGERRQRLAPPPGRAPRRGKGGKTKPARLCAPPPPPPEG